MDMVCTSLAFIDGLGGPEMVLIFVIVLVLFGGQKLPEFARGFGKSIREFKKAAAGVEEEFKRALEEDERKNSTAKLTAAPALPVGTSAAETGGPEAVHSPVTDDDVASGASSHDETSYDEGSHYEDAHQGGTSEVPTSSHDDSAGPANNDTPVEPKISPPGSPPPPPISAPPKSATPPPASASPENPS
jgi:TatA/E family protein of Tat protein translocase